MILAVVPGSRNGRLAGCPCDHHPSCQLGGSVVVGAGAVVVVANVVDVANVVVVAGVVGDVVVGTGVVVGEAGGVECSSAMPVVVDVVGGGGVVVEVVELVVVEFGSTQSKMGSWAP